MSEISTSQRLEKEIEQLANLEKLLEKGEGTLFVNNNSHPVMLSTQVGHGYKEEFLNIVRSVKGLALLSLNLPNNEYREKIQGEVLKILPNFNQMLKLNSMPSQNSSIQSIPVEGFRFTYTFDTNKKSFVATLNYQNVNSIPSIQTRILGIHGLIEEALSVNQDAVSQVEDYKNFLEGKLNELYEVKKNLEEFIKEKSLEEFSNRFKEEAEQVPVMKSIAVTFALVILTTVMLVYVIIEAISGTSTTASWQLFLAKLSIIAFFGGISIYLLRYTLRLIERRQEYLYKSLVLSTFPALNFFLQDDRSRYELIKTLILENQKLQTLSPKEEKLPVEEIVKLLSVIKSSK